MQESSETASTPALATIHALVRGSSIRLSSSAKLGWSSVHLEHHKALPLERSEAVSPHHAIVLFTNYVRGECAAERGRFVPCSYSPGEFKIYPAGPISRCWPFSEFRMTMCALDPNLVAEVGEEVDAPSIGEFRPLMNLRDQSLQSIIRLLAAEADSGGLSGRLYVEHLAHVLALRFRQVSGGLPLARPSASGKMPGPILRRVLDKMKAEFSTDLDLKTIAAESGYSRTHFLRTFRASTGYSPHQWLTHLRIEEAKTLLQKASNSLIDIALDCGFSSHGHFSNTFRRIVGVAPRDYRRNYGLIP